jgi:hypothetical protein
MAWTLAEIEAQWLGGGSITLAADQTLAAFNHVESLFGREWMEASRRQHGIVSSGLHMVMDIWTKSERLATLEAIPNHSSLLERLRRNDTDAWAELTAIHIIMLDEDSVLVELEPEVVVDGRQTKPDFRASRLNEPWIYVEVTQPHESLAEQRLYRLLEELTHIPDIGAPSYALEVFLRRQPRPNEVASIVARVREVYKLSGQHKEELSRHAATE